MSFSERMTQAGIREMAAGGADSLRHGGGCDKPNPPPCYGKVEMSPLSKVEMSPFVEAGGGRFERGRFGDERDGAGAV